MFESDITRAIYEAVSDIIINSDALSYCRTRQRGFYPKSENLLSPTMFPMIFLEYGMVSEITNPRTLVWEYNYNIPIVCITLADKGNFEDLVFNLENKNNNKGIGDIIYDVKKLLWAYHGSNFGIENVQSWNIAGIHVPNVLNVQRMLANEFVRAMQITLTFRVWEKA